MAETTAEMIAVMQAAERGEAIEVRSKRHLKDRWTACASAHWNWVECDYRVRSREPRELFVNFYADGSWNSYVSRDAADRVESVKYRAGEAVCFREVIED